MLDERLIGTTFTITTRDNPGAVMLYGIRYHYRVVGAFKIGEVVIVEQVTPLELIVRTLGTHLSF